MLDIPPEIRHQRPHQHPEGPAPGEHPESTQHLDSPAGAFFVPTQCRRRRQRQQKQGKRGGLWAKLRANPHRPALPSLLLSNCRSLVNKIDKIRLRVFSDKTSRCVTVFTETWLDNSAPDKAIRLHGCTVYRADRTACSGKKRAGGVCVYINNDWCTAVDITGTHCSPDLEYLAVKCRPFYLPREFSVIHITAVYIPPHANSKLALEELHSLVNSQLNAHPEGAVIVAGDFSHAELKTVLPKLHKHIDFPTRDNNILDQVYTNIKGAYKAAAAPHLGLSDPISLLMRPSYRPVRCRSRPIKKIVQVWSEEATASVQHCFETTHWDLFAEGSDLEGYTAAVLDYINFRILTDYKSNTTRVSQDKDLPDMLNLFFARFENQQGRAQPAERMQPLYAPSTMTLLIFNYYSYYLVVFNPYCLLNYGLTACRSCPVLC